MTCKHCLDARMIVRITITPVMATAIASRVQLYPSIGPPQAEDARR